MLRSGVMMAVFIATVNHATSFADHTGASRWWTIGVERLDFNRGIDMRQVFAEIVARNLDFALEANRGTRRIPAFACSHLGSRSLTTPS